MYAVRFACMHVEWNVTQPITSIERMSITMHFIPTRSAALAPSTPDRHRVTDISPSYSLNLFRELLAFDSSLYVSFGATQVAEPVADVAPTISAR